MLALNKDKYHSYLKTKKATMKALFILYSMLTCLNEFLKISWKSKKVKVTILRRSLPSHFETDIYCEVRFLDVANIIKIQLTLFLFLF